MELTHLFDLALRYDGNTPGCPPPGTKEGQLLGSGEGSAEGALLRGKVRWSNYEHNLAPGLCRLQIPGVIQTDDGAEIQFEAHGHAMQSDALQPNLWASAGAFLFTTQNARYSWLVNRPVVWTGEFDANILQAVNREYERAVEALGWDGAEGGYQGAHWDSYDMIEQIGIADFARMGR